MAGVSSHKSADLQPMKTALAILCIVLCLYCNRAVLGASVKRMQRRSHPLTAGVSQAEHWTVTAW